MKKRIISIILAFAVVLGLVPTVMAEGGTSVSRAYSATRSLLSRQKGTYQWANGNVNADDWCAFALARDGISIPQSYIDSVEKFTPTAKSSVSECGRAILLLTACGEEVRDALLTAVTAKYNFAYSGDVIYALLALDSKNYTVPTGGMSRKELINLLLNLQQKDHAWGYSYYDTDMWETPYGTDVDTTAEAITALTPYYSDAKVKTAVDNALLYLKSQQNADGTFGYGGSASVESTAQVIVALTSLEIDPTDWNGKNMVKAMCTMAETSGGFLNYENKYDEYSTANGYYALVAYERFKAHKTALYDMTDVNAGGEKGCCLLRSILAVVPALNAVISAIADKIPTRNGMTIGSLIYGILSVGALLSVRYIGNMYN